MSKKFKIINLVVFCAWIILISLLLYKNYTGIPIEKAANLKKSFETQNYWYDIYDGKKKIGFAKATFDKAGNENIITHEQKIKVIRNGHETLFIEKLRCLCDLHYSIKSFEYTSHFGYKKGIKVTGEVDKDKIIFFLETPEKRKTFETPTKGRDFYIPMTFTPALIQKNPAPGSVFTIPVLDFSSLSINDTRVELIEIRPIKVGINILSLYKFKSGPMIWWSNEKGIGIKDEYPSGVTVYSQIEQFAIDPTNRILFDYTSLSFFKSNKLITDTEKLSFLRVKIKGFKLDPQTYENSFVSLKGDLLEIKKTDIEKDMKANSYALPFKDDKFKMYLNADEWVLSENKNIKGNALHFAAIENNDAFRLSRYLNSDIYFTVRLMPLFTLSNSLDIFKSKLGNYLEKTVMFSSFARAAGLPTRMISGLVYRDGYFYYHTWPEVWFGKWIPVDPTLSQFPADVTHIPLKEGTLKDITSIVNDLQNISIQILEAI